MSYFKGKIYRDLNRNNRSVFIRCFFILDFILIGAIVSMLVFIVLETATIADYSFRAIVLDQRLVELKTAVSTLEMQTNYQESVMALNNEIKNLPMFKISTVEYLIPEESIVVVK